jgi:hypothetical protein
MTVCGSVSGTPPPPDDRAGNSVTGRKEVDPALHLELLPSTTLSGIWDGKRPGDRHPLSGWQRRPHDVPVCVPRSGERVPGIGSGWPAEFTHP